MDGEAVYYGLNALSHNVIMANRKKLKNPNGLFLGVPGSGKSFAAKRELVNVFLATRDRIIVVDPMGEYSPLIKRLGGQVIEIAPDSPHHINPMDIDLSFDEENPMALKADFILSLMELIVGGKDGLQPVERTVIDRCVRQMYREHLQDPETSKMPTLQTLYDLLCSQPEGEAVRLATALEIYGGTILQQNWKFQRGDIFFTHFGASTGSEQCGDRPAVILQNDVGNYHSPTLIVATMTSKAEKKVNQPTHCLLENAGLNMPSVVQAEQIFTIDKSRALKYLGHLTPEEMRRVDDAVRISLALNPMGSIQQMEPIRRSTAVYAPPEVVDGKPPVYPYTPIRSSFENAGSIEEMMLYTELQSAVHAMIQRLEYSFTFNPSLLTIPKRKQQVAEILEEAEKYIWRIKEEMRCA